MAELKTIKRLSSINGNLGSKKSNIYTIDEDVPCDHENSFQGHVNAGAQFSDITIDVHDDDVNNGKFESPIEIEGRLHAGTPLRKPWKYKKALKHLIPVRFSTKKAEDLPMRKAGLFSFCTFGWLTSLMWKAFKQRNETFDIRGVWKCSQDESSLQNAKRIEKLWNIEVKRNGTNASFSRVWFKFIRTRFILNCFILVICMGCLFTSNTFLVKEILEYAQMPTENYSYGLILVGCMLLSEVIRALTFSAIWAISYQEGIRLRNGLMMFIYQKILRVKGMRGLVTSGQLANICGNDGERIFDATSKVVMILGGPICLLAGIGYGYYLVGPWALLGLAVFILFYLLQFKISRLTTVFRQKCINITDARVKNTLEVLENIKFIKFSNYEKVFSPRIFNLRKEETKTLKRSAYIQGLSTALIPVVPVIAAVCTFVGFTLSGNALKSPTAFAVLGVFTYMRSALGILPAALKSVSEARSSFLRIKSILELPEQTQTARKDISNTIKSPIKLSDATFKRISKQNTDIPYDATIKHCLNDINFEIQQNQLVGVCGQVGHGKSTLCEAILGELELIRGDIRINGTIGYAPQTPWLFNDTVKENILFGELFDEIRYKHVITVCGLELDLEQLQSGDQTEIGERGTTLSGGQKQRISLARAVYANRDVYVLDDPLSALDTTVAEHVYEKCIRQALAEKTVILVSHNMEVLSRCDWIMYLKQGSISEMGSVADLTAIGGDFAKLSESMAKTINEDEKTKSKVSSKTKLPDGSGKVKQNGRNGLVKKEERRRGKVPPKVYKAYCNYAGGLCFSFLVVFFFLCYVGSLVGSNLWLSYWLERTDPKMPYGNEFNTTARSRMLLHDDDMNEMSHHKKRDVSIGLTANYTEFNQTIFELGSTNGMANMTSSSGDAVPTIAVTIKANETTTLKTKTDETSTVNTDQSTGTATMSTIQTTVSTSEANGTETTFQTSTTTDREMRTSTDAESTMTSSSYPALSSSKSPSITTASSSSSAAPTDNGSIKEYESPVFYVRIYAVILGIIALVGVLKILIYVKATLMAASTLHNVALKTLVASPLKFFEENPTGRIINRFSKDQDEVDVRLPAVIDILLQNLLQIVSSLCLIVAVFPWFLVAAVPIGIMFLLLNIGVNVGIREMKRWDNISRSPVLSHLNTTVTGITSIVAFAKREMFVKRFADSLDDNAVPFFLFNCAMRWFAVRLDLIGALISTAVALMIVLTKGGIPASYAGLALTYATQITGIFQFTVRTKAEVEARFTSVERLWNYCKDLEPEEDVKNIVGKPQKEWPDNGVISVDNFSLKYNNDGPRVLDNISLNIYSGEKVGIIGRTGSGKSSLTMALLRMVEADMGRIVIDNVDISKISLEAVRSKIVIIPQDPVVFKGTIRFNLDPCGNLTSDDDIWKILDLLNMRNKIASTELKLDNKLGENGAEFSAGEKQLICLARALLRKPKILILDEATSSMDAETDRIISHVIDTAITGCTIIIIAHRLETVQHCDKIISMENGKIVKMGTPDEMLKL
ncbi:unnamed protein product [Owenia fusiformis]|uniref:Uncharacterized protein n=1 Tax=Owenia fusiformis TaxID=6347 RepID=A0A8J1UKY4_OWEFU|nr:unnamed protein product [Owenia fusiformis]